MNISSPREFRHHDAFAQQGNSAALANPIQQQHAPLRVRSTVQRHQSPERPILRQISSLMYPKIQRRQVIMNVLHPGCARPPWWSPPGPCRRFEDGLASICVLIHSCKMPRESEMTGLGCHTATGTHMPHGITQCYLPPGRGDIPALTPAEAGTRLSDPGGMQG